MEVCVMFIVGSIISGLIGFGCLIGCIVSIYSQSRKRKGSVSAAGFVVGLEKRVFNPGSAGVYCPVVEFSTNTGENIRFESPFGTMPASNKVGDTVKVFYNPNNPKDAEIDSGITKWLTPGCLFLFSLGACFFSIVFLGLFVLMSNNQ
jgi:hypothetical protein